MARFFGALILLTAVLALPTLVTAQDAVLERIEADITVKVVDAASGQPVQAERVLVRERGAAMTVVGEAWDVDGAVTFKDVGVFNFRPYIVSAWVAGIGYHVQRNGQVFLDGQPAVVHAFENTDDLDGLTITGMNVVVRQREDGFQLEYIATIDNQSRPQRTIRATALPLRLLLPPGLQQIEVEVDSGPDPLTGEIRPADDGFSGVATALTPGEARITVRGMLPVGGRAEITVATNLPVAKWSLLAWPADLDVRSFDLERDDSNEYREFARWVGPELAIGREVDVTIDAAPPEVAERVFTQPSSQSRPTTDPRRAERRGPPWLTIIAAVILGGLYLVWKIRR